MNTPWKFFTSTKAALDGMYEACAAATSSIDCEQFIFENDSEGERFAELFIKKAGEGVKVRLLADTAGTLQVQAVQAPPPSPTKSKWRGPKRPPPTYPRLASRPPPNTLQPRQSQQSRQHRTCQR
jgi:phosphatidylserine/phosphatidylglycerophosphate/cardiolipin synthase-like enzyme